MQLAFRSEQGGLPRNEDVLLANPTEGFFVLCDGFSVKAGGEQAARTLTESLQAWFLSRRSRLPKNIQVLPKEERFQWASDLRETMNGISRSIYQRAATDPSLHGMCTGFDLLLLLGPQALVAHVGAGRILLNRQGSLHQLTEDHTQLAHLRRAGKLDGTTPQQQQAFSHRVTRAVGFQEDVSTDVLFLELEQKDRFYLVTDGVWQTLGDPATRAEMIAAGPAGNCLESLHQAVTSKSPRDNFSSIVVDPEPAPVPVAVAVGAEQKVKMLGKVPAFEYLPYQDLLKVLSVGDLVKVGAGEALCREGDAGEEMMLVLSGSVEVTKSGKVIRKLEKGDVFGEMSMIDAGPRSASVIATTATNLLAFPRSSLFELLREHPDVAVKFLWGVATELNERLRAASNQLVGRPAQEGTRSQSQAKAQGPLPFDRSQ